MGRCSGIAAGGHERGLWLTTDATPVHDARVLTEGGSLARIVLDGQVYALRITRAGKLILTK
jgi:hemin uptake protein HemP